MPPSDAEKPLPAPYGWTQVDPAAQARQAWAWLPAPPPDARKRSGTIGWDIVMGIDTGLLMLGGFISVLVYLVFLMGGPQPSGDSSPGLLWFNNVLNLIMMAIIPMVWLLGTRVEPVAGMVRYLRLERFWPAVGHGLGYAALLLGLVMFFLLFLDLIGAPMEETGAEDRFLGLTLPLVFVTSFVAGFAEEVFFRGVLQKWTGMWGQAIIFGLFHLAGGWIAFLVTGAIGLLFGYLVKNGRSLWLVISAHFFYDLFLLFFAYVGQGSAPEALSALLP